MKEKSIVLTELQQNDFCEIEQKNGRLYLNNKDITSIRFELFKILKQSILSLQTSLEFQKYELQKLFGESIIESKIRSNKDSITQPQTIITHYEDYYEEYDDDDNNEGDGGDDDNNNNEGDNNDEITIVPQEFQKVSQNTIIDQSYENILIDQYFSIILMNSFISDNAQTLQIQEASKDSQRRHDQYNLEYNNEEDRINQNISQTKEENNEKITFLSPFNKKQDNVQIFKIRTELHLILAFTQDDCDFCHQNYNSLHQINQFLFKTKKVLIVDEISASIGQEFYCKHQQQQLINYGIDGTYFNDDLSSELSNIKYRSLILLQPNFQDQQYNNYKNKLIINQSKYLKEIDISIFLLPYIEIKQTENQFLQRLALNSVYFSKMKFSEMKEYLDNIKFSQIKINVICNTNRNQVQLLIASGLLNYNSLIYVQKCFKGFSEEDKEIIEIMNKKYINQLCLFAFHKLFKDQFSVFRLTYDLYDQD